jgi:hypothetical protein
MRIFLGKSKAGIIDSKSCPSAPRPCNQIMAPSGFPLISFSTVSIMLNA